MGMGVFLVARPFHFDSEEGRKEGRKAVEKFVENSEVK